MPRPLAAAALVLLALAGGGLGLLVSPLFLLAVPPALAGAVAAGVGLDARRLLDDGGDPGKGPAGLPL